MYRASFLHHIYLKALISKWVINPLPALRGSLQSATSVRTVINHPRCCLYLLVSTLYTAVTQWLAELLIWHSLCATSYTFIRTCNPPWQLIWMMRIADVPAQPDSHSSNCAALLYTLIYTSPSRMTPLLQMHLKMRLITGDCHVEMSRPPAIGNVPYQSNPAH